MKERASIFRLCCFGTIAAATLLMGCSSNDARAERAFNDYQTAIGAGDLVAARNSLLRAVSAKDDVADYWEALGELQLQLGKMNDAAYAFTRANELDRSNTKVLSALAELSLVGGDLDSAHNYERQLALLDPNDAAVFLVEGYLALRRGELDAADANADKLIKMLPLDPGGKLLKARVLAARGERDQAVDLLAKQAAAKPNDSASLKALLLLLKREDDWPKLASTAARLAQLEPGDDSAALTAIEAALRAKDIDLATNMSLSLLGPSAPPNQVDSVLQLWRRYWETPAAIQRATELAAAAPLQQRLAYATFFNAVGQPAKAAELAGGPKMPVTLSNSGSNAIFAQSLAISGHSDAARKLFDAILAKEPDHVYALRGRTEIEINDKQARSAVRDAERLITIEPNSAEDRLLLSRAYAAGGDARGAIQCLWDGFHDIPANEQMYQALRSAVAKKNGEAAAAQVDAEFNHQRDVKFEREFI